MTATAQRSLRQTCDQHSRYTRGCTGCRQRSAHRRRVRHRLVAYGTWRGMVDAQPARQRVTDLLFAGWSQRRIAATAGVGRSVVDNLAAGLVTQMYAHTSDKILRLAVAPRQPTGYDRIDGTGVARRLQALTALGHPVVKLAAELGVSGQSVRRWRRRRYPDISAVRAQAIRDLYDRLSHIPGTCQRTRDEATRNGWHGPLVWDDDTIDDPTAQPDLGNSSADDDLIDEIAVDLALTGQQVRLTRAERDRAIAVGLARGLTSAAIADRLHISGSTANHIANRIRNQGA
ncbi:hypothetical protein [Verrucosispora sp. WMMD1129]|uniref:helix-turn-helix transcriptional regulator n=1 Tax=Verrucosispora sp. WMMD1129 TaxID=3016093 RepID=UPI002499D29D|nr:hypothetical protein [Verrucosispora sp. WMMD1129]WFE45326.1 hypothetical protein O7624_13675 [Verrucosispora sp. WMMD1129]